MSTTVDTSKPETKSSMRIEDAELQAMAKVNKIMADLPQETRRRVLAYMNSRYSDLCVNALGGSDTAQGKRGVSADEFG